MTHPLKINLKISGSISSFSVSAFTRMSQLEIIQFTDRISKICLRDLNLLLSCPRF